ncbi:hypothetical protein MNV49_005357 [Pseudohyphozyma bogoriensis]|nr:hypothetical protein MNV49_005357 [Pseudohyphozyma bogoriensis]
MADNTSKPSSYADEKLGVAALDADSPELKKIDRKIILKSDLFVCFFLTIVTTVEFLDKNALSFAAVYGLKTDTHLVGQEYSNVASVFYYGYLGTLPFISWFLTRFSASKLIGVSATLWGVTLLCMAACKNYGGLIAVRFILGIFEAPILPSCMVISSLWWTKREQGLRTAIWFNTLAGVFGGILAYAIGHITHSKLATWRLLFIIYGAFTVLLGIAVTLVMPDKPGNAWFLTAEEKARAEVRLADNRQGAIKHAFKMSQVYEALKSPQYWIVCLFTILQAITNAGVSNFNPLIISGFGFSAARTTLMATPQAAVAIIAQVCLTTIALYVPNIRCLLWFLSCLPALVGAILIHVLNHVTQRPAALAGVYLMGFYNPPFVLATSLAISNVSGTTKKAFVSSSVAVSYAIGNIVGPQAFRASESPVYRSGIFTMLCCFGIEAFFALCYWAVTIYLNRAKDAKYGPPQPLAEGLVEEEDLTDVENTNFRYSY